MRASKSAGCGVKDSSKPAAAPATAPTPVGCDGCGKCGEMLHGLNNALASVLLNAQVMAWKLPSYSRSKRYLHEIERNAQRGGELVKRLLERSHDGCPPEPGEGQSGGEAPAGLAFDCALPGHEVDEAGLPVDRRPEA